MLADYSCEVCGKVGEYLDWEKPVCCDKPMHRIFSLSRYTKPPKGVSFDFLPGYDWGAGKHFDTKRERDFWEATSGVTVKDKGYYGPIKRPEER